MGGVVLAVAIAAIIGAYVGQVALNEHARNLSFAIQDANRIIEQIRQVNSGAGCANPTIVPPGAASWDAWLAGAGGGGKSLLPDPANNERIAVTCQNSTGTQYCPAAQMGTEWHAAGPVGVIDPLRLTVAVCWRHRMRIIGECAWNGATLSANDANADGIITSPVVLTTVVTCRG